MVVDGFVGHACGGGEGMGAGEDSDIVFLGGDGGVEDLGCDVWSRDVNLRGSKMCSCGVRSWVGGMYFRCLQLLRFEPS
jgi:hypothetical protein